MLTAWRAGLCGTCLQKFWQVVTLVPSKGCVPDMSSLLHVVFTLGTSPLCPWMLPRPSAREKRNLATLCTYMWGRTKNHCKMVLPNPYSSLKDDPEECDKDHINESSVSTINQSVSQGTFPWLLKEAVICHLKQNPSLQKHEVYCYSVCSLFFFWAKCSKEQ